MGDATQQSPGPAAFEQLSAEKERFRELSDAAFEAIVVHDRGIIVDVNQAMVEMFGYPREELIGAATLDLAAPESRDLIRHKMATGAPAPYEAVGLRKDGSKLLGQLRGGPIHYQGRALRVVAIRDISEQKKLESQIQLQQQLLSMNALAAGVAHEINNPLTYVLGNLQLLAQHLDQLDPALPATTGSELRRCLEEALTGTERVRAIVGDLRRLSRPTTDDRTPLDLRPVVETALRMVGNEIRHRARVVREFNQCPRVSATDLRLLQVFVNLLLNAAQSMEDGRAGSNEIRVAIGCDERGRATVDITDTGRGIAPELHTRVFEPFFTTKREGVGLGLSVSRSIVQDLGGEISLQSLPGRGTTFRVALPGVPLPGLPNPRREPAPPFAPMPSPSLRILIVDDEPAVGETLRRMVMPEHRADSVTSMKAALERITIDPNYDVILCDLMMPEGTGIDLSVRLGELAPRLADRVLFMTGGVFTPAVEEFLSRGNVPMVEKPIRRDPLLAALAAFANGR